MRKKTKETIRTMLENRFKVAAKALDVERLTVSDAALIAANYLEDLEEAKTIKIIMKRS